MREFMKPARLTVLLAALLAGVLAIGCDNGDTQVIRPASPTILSAERGDGTLTVTWNDVKDAVSYDINWRIAGVEESRTGAFGVFSGYTFNANNRSHYEIWVRSVDGAGRYSNWSGVYSTSPYAPVPVIRMTANEHNSVTVSWNVEGVDGFNIKWSEAIDLDDATSFNTSGLYTGTTATITGLARETIYSVWVQSVIVETVGDAGEEIVTLGDWGRATVATFPFTDAFDIIVVGAGGAGGAAVIGAKSAGFEHITSEGANNPAFMADPANWNDLQVLLLEKRSIWGGMTNTAGGGNANPGNRSQWEAANEDFASFRTRYSRFIMSVATMGAALFEPDAAIADNQNHPGHIRLGQHYPNWSKSWALFRQMSATNNWLRHRGNANSFGSAAEMNAMMGRITNPQTGIAAYRNNTQATELLTNAAGEVIGVRTNEVIGSSGSGSQGITLGEPLGREELVAARKVILATGGFSNLPADEQYEKIIRHIPAEVRNENAAGFFSTGYVNSYGTGIIMAHDIGAALMGNYGAINANMVLAANLNHLHIGAETIGGVEFPEGNWGNFFAARTFFSTSSPMWRPAQIMVNNQGLRFRPENAWNTNAAVYDMMVANDGNNWPVWAIFSDLHLARVVTVDGAEVQLDAITPLAAGGFGAQSGSAPPSGGARTRQQVLERVYAFLQTLDDSDIRKFDIVRGDTLEDLAIAMGVPVNAFVAEVLGYDAAVKAALAADGVWTDPLEASGRPGKPAGTDNANLIRFLEDDDSYGTESGPFWAVRVNPAVWDSTGGVATDIWGRVLREELPRAGGGQPGLAVSFSANHIVPANPADIIRNLYAAGAVANRAYYGYQYQSMSSLGMAPTQGALSGRHAAREILGLTQGLEVEVANSNIATITFPTNP